MAQARRIFLEVCASNPHGSRSSARGDGDAAVLRKRKIKLTDLVTLREVGIEVVLPVPTCGCGTLRTDRGTHGEYFLNGSSVRHREGAWEAEAGWAGARVWRVPLCWDRTRTEHLRCGAQLHMDLNADHRLPTHAETP